MQTGSVVKLKCHYNNYSWGKTGADSEVARLFKAHFKGFQIDEDKPYSELWMGTHPDGPARLVDRPETTLSTFIAKSKSDVFLNKGLKKPSRNEHHLPFIMKVMSIDKPLSLQVHPTKAQAEWLHEKDPLHYPDRNHKPELAYALTDFELLCGFRPPLEMLRNLEAFASFRMLFGGAGPLLQLLTLTPPEIVQTQRSEQLKMCFQYMMLEIDEPARYVDWLMEELGKGVRGALEEKTVQVIEKMVQEFPGDIGAFSPLFLNHMMLKPGECCYYAAEELHAYLSGECVEAVGCSNNTIRAAMTPKFIDRESLIEVLNYKMTPQSDYLVPPNPLRDYPAVDEYAPDCEDFQLHRVRVARDSEDARLPPLGCGSIIVIHSGSAIMETDEPSISGDTHSYNDLTEIQSCFVKRGDIFYISPGKRLRFTRCTEDLEAFRTFSYEEGPDHESNTVVAKRCLNGVDFEPIDCASDFQRPKFNLASSTESGIFEVETEMDGFM